RSDVPPVGRFPGRRRERPAPPPAGGSPRGAPPWSWCTARDRDDDDLALTRQRRQYGGQLGLRDEDLDGRSACGREEGLALEQVRDDQLLGEEPGRVEVCVGGLPRTQGRGEPEVDECPLRHAVRHTAGQGDDDRAE